VVESFAKRYVPGGAGEGIDPTVGDGPEVAALVRSAGTEAHAIGAGVVAGGSGANVAVADRAAGVRPGDTVSGVHATVAIARRITARLIARTYHTRLARFGPYRVARNLRSGPCMAVWRGSDVG
jgi:hypothetical protein